LIGPNQGEQERNSKQYGSPEWAREGSCEELCIQVVREVVETSRRDQRRKGKYMYRSKNVAGERGFSSILSLRRELWSAEMCRRSTHRIVVGLRRLGG
jgi:hypothetical protein